MISTAQVVGKDKSALQAVGTHWLHSETVSDWQALQAAAKKDGFELAIASAYRSFDRQMLIWNEKAEGKRPMFDSNGKPLDIHQLSDTEKVFAILKWSALPGGSRHHWGTDIDIYDLAAVPDDYAVQLSDEEVSDTGVFGALHQWLDNCIDCDRAFSFYRPYQTLGQGVAPERWHLSHAAVSQRYSQCLSADMLYQVLEQEPTMQLRDTVLAHFDKIFAQYISC